MIALLEQANERRLGIAAVISAQLGAYYKETGTTPADLRLALLSGRQSSMDTILRRAAERGEINPAMLTPRLIAPPFDLFRHEIMMTLAAVPHDVIVEIVDDIFLPLVSGATSG